MNGSMTTGEWKGLARRALLATGNWGTAWEEALNALLRASENEGLPILDDLVERLAKE